MGGGGVMNSNLTRTDTDLLPCPFCGNEADYYYNGETYIAQCSMCGAQTAEFEERDWAADAWNTRAERACTIEKRYSWWGAVSMHCGACGADLGCDTRNRQRYCPNCGAKVVE